MIRVGVLLSGCGAYDGTDVHEAVLVLLALDRAGARVECLVPSGVEGEAVDHSTGQMTEGEMRSVLVEAARLARGRVTPIAEARTSLFSALVIPGGQGVARCLMEGAVGGPGRGPRHARPDVAALVLRTLKERKPIGVVSLAGTLTATVLGLPLDEDPFSTPATEIRIDEENGIVWTPGSMASGRLSDMARGIDRMIEEVLARAPKGLPVAP